MSMNETDNFWLNESTAIERIKKNPGCFIRIPDQFVTKKMCDALVDHAPYGLSLAMIPSTMITAEMCDRAIAINPSSIAHVPRRLITEDRCIAALSNLNAHMFHMSAFQAILRTNPSHDVLNVAMKYHGEFLGVLPMQRRTPELCDLAIESYGESLYFVPDEHKSYERCLKAVMRSPYALHYVPDELLKNDNNRTILTMVAANSYMDVERIYEKISYLSEKEKTVLKDTQKNFKNMVHAVSENPEKFEYVPDGCLTYSFYDKVLLANEKVLHRIPQEKMTQGVENLIQKHERLEKELAMSFLRKIEANSAAFTLVPPRLITPAFCLEAVARNGDCLNYIPVNMQSDELRNIAYDSIRTGKNDNGTVMPRYPKPVPQHQ